MRLLLTNETLKVFEAISTGMQHALEITLLVWECNRNSNSEQFQFWVAKLRNQTKDCILNEFEEWGCTRKLIFYSFVNNFFPRRGANL